MTIPDEAGAGTSSTSARAEQPLAGKRVAVAHIALGDEWCNLAQKEFDTQLKALGAVEVNHQDGNLDQETQTRQIETFITQKYDVIFADPTAPGISAVLKKATDAGIPVILFDSLVEDDSSYISHIAWDAEETGTLCGEWVNQYAADKLGGSAKVAMLTMYLSHTLPRIDGFKNAVAGNSGIEIISEQDFEGSREKAYNIVMNLKDHVDVIFALEDNAAWGAIAALKAKGITDTKVISAGGFGEEPFQALRTKDPESFAGTVAVPPANIVESSIQAYLAYLDGKTDIEKEINVDIVLVTQENIMDLYPDPVS